MSFPIINNCPSTLAEGYSTYSGIGLKSVFGGKEVSHILPYDAPSSTKEADSSFDDNRKRMSISGVQEKFSVLLDRNKLRLVGEGEMGQYILKPIPSVGKKADQMPVNEHLTMQIARQVYGIATAENALIFFKNGAAAYITKRFDIDKTGNKFAQEDFAALIGNTAQTHGEHYKYLGNYLDIFQALKKYVSASALETPKLFRLVVFNYLFSNGDAHLKNFSLTETVMGDFRLSPAYDLLNSRIHVEDRDFALEDGLLPRNLGQGKIAKQFEVLAFEMGISKKVGIDIMKNMLNKSEKVEQLINFSFLNEKTKRSYWQHYQGRLKQLMKV